MILRLVPPVVILGKFSCVHDARKTVKTLRKGGVHEIFVNMDVTCDPCSHKTLIESKTLCAEKLQRVQVGTKIRQRV